jgi:hypothetical protein
VLVVLGGTFAEHAAMDVASEFVIAHFLRVMGTPAEAHESGPAGLGVSGIRRRSCSLTVARNPSATRPARATKEW